MNKYKKNKDHILPFLNIILLQTSIFQMRTPFPAVNYLVDNFNENVLMYINLITNSNYSSFLNPSYLNVYKNKSP